MSMTICARDGVNLKDKEEGDDDYDNDDNDDDDDDMCQQGWGMSLATTRLVGVGLGTAGGDHHQDFQDHHDDHDFHDYDQDDHDNDNDDGNDIVMINNDNADD